MYSEKDRHGGDVFTFEAEYGRMPLDFSANTNPLGMSPKARSAAVAALAAADRYPDPLCRDLRAAIAHAEKVPAEWLLCGNGAADLIYRLCMAVRPQRALLTAPTFSEYEEALTLVGCECRRHFLQEEEGFRLGEKILDDITADLDVLFLCEPNNPTGIVTDAQLLARIVALCRENDVLLVLDECFNGFLDHPEQWSGKRYLAQGNVVILKAFTKLYGMAGLRLGYMMTKNEDIVGRTAEAGQAWSVSSVAQAAGIAALQDEAYLLRSTALVAAERRRLAQGLTALGVMVYPSLANYLFVYVRRQNLQDDLAREGILIRDCSLYPGLRQGYYRIAVRDHDENNWLLQALGKILR